uniref:Secreted protein n=1 Tax=Oryza barthii TaxID=65489 RepID=A0A0D3FSP4_9ORYZ
MFITPVQPACVICFSSFCVCSSQQFSPLRARQSQGLLHDRAPGVAAWNVRAAQRSGVHTTTKSVFPDGENQFLQAERRATSNQRPEKIVILASGPHPLVKIEFRRWLIKKSVSEN